MRLQFGLSSYERARGDMPGLPVVNMFAEDAPTEETGVVLQSRPGLVDRASDMGAGPVAGLYQADGVLGGGLFGVSGGKLYSEGSEIGAIDGSGPVSWGGYENTLFVTAGEGLWGYDGSTLAEIAFPDDAPVAAVTVGASRLIVVRKDTQQFYWSTPLDDTIGGQAFASAEDSPDRLRDLLFVDDTLILFGAETVEFWPNTQDANLPFQPLQGRVIERGIIQTGACTSFGPTFAWVTNYGEVCIQSEQNVISNVGLQTRINASSDVRLFNFMLDGVEFLALRLDDETQVYSGRSRMWSEFQTYDLVNWQAGCAAKDVFGSAVDGKTMTWGSAHVDMGKVLERRFRAGAPINAGGFNVNNLIVRTSPGRTPFLTGDYDEPVIEMRLSRDAGQTWSAWRQKPLGAQGKYRTKVAWRGLGMASQPGFFAEFRVTDPVEARFSDVEINSAWGGR